MQAKFDGGAAGRPERSVGVDKIDECEPETLREKHLPVADTPLDRLSARLVPPRRSNPSLAPTSHLEPTTTRTSTLPSASTVEPPRAAPPRRPSSTPPPPPPARPLHLHPANAKSTPPQPESNADEDARIDVDQLFSFASPTLAPPPMRTTPGAAPRTGPRGRTERPPRRPRRPLRANQAAAEPRPEADEKRLGRRTTGWAVAMIFGAALAALGYGLGARGPDDGRGAVLATQGGPDVGASRAAELQPTDAPTTMAPAVDSTAAVAAVSAAAAPVAGFLPTTSLVPRTSPRDEARATTEGPAPDASAEQAGPVSAPRPPSSSVPSPSLEGATAPIDRAALGNAIAAAAASAAGCVSDPSAPSSVRIEAVFAPSGRTTRTSVVGGPFAGTETGACIARALREMQVPAFDGEAVVVTKTVRLR